MLIVIDNFWKIDWGWVFLLFIWDCIQRVVPLRQSNALKSLTTTSFVSQPQGKIMVRLCSYKSNYMVNCFSVNLAIVIKAFIWCLGRAEFSSFKALLHRSSTLQALRNCAEESAYFFEELQCLRGGHPIIRPYSKKLG